MTTDIRSQPRVRAYGNSRIEITKRAQDENEWQDLWRESLNPFPFKWGRTWKHCIEYRVEDFASEVGFFIDILGLQVSTFSPAYAQFTSPDQEFTFAVTAAAEGEPGTPPDAIRLQFQIDYLMDTILELESRGIFFEKRPAEVSDSSALAVACFRSPHGIPIDLVGEVSIETDTEEDAEFEDLSFQQIDEKEDLEDMGLDIEDELGDRTNGLEEQDESQELTEPEESLASDLDEANASGLLSWTNLVTRQEAHRSRRGQTQTYPRPSKTNKFRVSSHDDPSGRPPRKQHSNGELTYSALEEEVQEYDD